MFGTMEYYDKAASEWAERGYEAVGIDESCFHILSGRHILEILTGHNLVW